MTTLPSRLRLVVGVVGSLLIAWLLVRTAWVSDDAFITLRTVHNALEGYGLRFNVVERVQTYTHPLWMVLLLGAHALTGEPFYGTLVLSGVTTLLGVAGLVATARSSGSLAVALALLAASKAWIDFATSGLENPLTHLVMLGAFTLALRDGRTPRDATLATGLWSLAFLTRPDAILLVTPLVGWLLWRMDRTRRHVLAAVAGLLPLVGWEFFSLGYYGALLPNTAFAKLGSGVPLDERIAQGLAYARHPWLHDRATLLALLAIVPLVIVHRRAAERALLAGSLLHTVYVVWVGGDFMAGRFWTPVVFAVALATARLRLPVWTVGVAVVGLALATLQPHAPLRSGPTYARHPAHEGIMDERGFYFQGAGLLSTRPPLDHAYARAGRRARQTGRRAVVRATIGYFGYFAGPTVHVTDPLALADPLYARLPAQLDPNWRVGHHRRAPVPGYEPSVGRPPDDPALAALYARLLRLTRGPPLDPGRWLDGLVLQIVGGPERFAAHRFAALRRVRAGSPFQVGREGVWLPGPGGDTLDVDADRTLTVLFVLDHEVVGEATVVSGGPPVELPIIDGVALFPDRRGGSAAQVRRLTFR